MNATGGTWYFIQITISKNVVDLNWIGERVR